MTLDLDVSETMTLIPKRQIVAKQKKPWSSMFDIRQPNISIDKTVKEYVQNKVEHNPYSIISLTWGSEAKHDEEENRKRLLITYDSYGMS